MKYNGKPLPQHLVNSLRRMRNQGNMSLRDIQRHTGLAMRTVQKYVGTLEGIEAEVGRKLTSDERWRLAEGDESAAIEDFERTVTPEDLSEFDDG